MEMLMSKPITGIIICIGAYTAGVMISRKTKSSFANPLVIAALLIIILIRSGVMTLEQFQSGGQFVTFFIVPATTVLALQIHRQWELLKLNIFPVTAGCFAGSVASIVSVSLLCRFFSIDGEIAASLLPKSVTTAIALDLAEKNGGIGSLAVSAVILTGIISSVTSPLLIKALRLRDPMAAGTAFGVSGHAIGTAKAIQLGETEGAMSSIALSLTGVFTSLLYVFIF